MKERKGLLQTYQHELRYADPYLNDGEISFAIWYPQVTDLPGRIELMTLNEWREYDKDLGRLLEERSKKVFWPLPSEPDIECDDIWLHRDLIRCVHEIIDFSEKEHDSIFTAWNICSYVPEAFSYSPRESFDGPTESGKGQALKTIRLLGYRGTLVGDPTPAIVYRMAESYRPTLCVEEMQDLPREVRDKIIVLYKLGFDRIPIPRMNNDNTDIEFFPSDSFMAVSVKNWKLPEDCLNRTIQYNMRKNQREVRPSEDDDEKAGLRARLLSFRLKVLSGRIDLTPYHNQIRNIIDNPVIIGEKDYTLKGRTKDIATILLLPAVIFKDTDDVLKVILDSEMKAHARMCETFEAQVFFALQRMNANQEINELPIPFENRDRLWAVNVKVVLEDDLSNQGNLKEGAEIPTRRVAHSLETLGFHLKTGRGNKRYIDKDTYDSVYQVNLTKYGKRGDDSSN